MATYRQRGDSWQVIVRHKGESAYETFPSKAQAEAWAKKKEEAMIAGKKNPGAVKTLGDLLDRYAKEESPKKAGAEKEVLRFEAYKRDFPELATLRLKDVTPEVVAKWRDKRLESVSDGTVRREWNTLSKAFNIAVKQWKWMESNPLKSIDRPPEPEPRDQLYTKDLINRIVFVTGYEPDTVIDTIAKRLGAMFLFACETAMRCKEMTNMRWEDVNLAARTVAIPKQAVGRRTKTGARNVPLSTEAVRILKHLEQYKDGDLVFNMTERQVDAHFRKYRGQAMVEGYTFHDSKHYAVTNLAKHMPIQDLARMVGTRNLKVLMGYYNKSAAEIATLLP